jgi:hypothetical protein
MQAIPPPIKSSEFFWPLCDEASTSRGRCNRAVPKPLADQRWQQQARVSWQPRGLPIRIRPESRQRPRGALHFKILAPRGAPGQSGRRMNALLRSASTIGREVALWFRPELRVGNLLFLAAVDRRPERRIKRGSRTLGLDLLLQLGDLLLLSCILLL